MPQNSLFGKSLSQNLYNTLIDLGKSFKEVTNNRLNNFSLLNQFRIFLDNNTYFWNIFDNYIVSDNVKNNENYISYYHVPHDCFWEDIADEIYDNENLWWIIAMTNNVNNPFEELNEGDIIKIIDKRFINDILKEVKNL